MSKPTLTCLSLDCPERNGGKCKYEEIDDALFLAEMSVASWMREQGIADEDVLKPEDVEELLSQYTWHLRLKYKAAVEDVQKRIGVESTDNLCHYPIHARLGMWCANTRPCEQHGDWQKQLQYSIITTSR